MSGVEDPVDSLGDDRSALFVLGAASLAFRLAYIMRDRYSSDEPQHLHVVWSWVRGLVQYRDVFDNHAPAFHLLFVPLAAWVGERPDAVRWMRFGILPLVALELYATYELGRILFGRRVAAWITLAVSVAPGFFIPSVEFRADALWTAAWLLALAVLLRGEMTVGRAARAGLLAGLALSASMKTTLLLGALALGCGMVHVRARPAALLSRSFAFAAGIFVVPLALLLFFALHDAAAPLYADVILHNALPGVGGPSHGIPRGYFLIGLCVVGAVVSSLDRLAVTAALGHRYALLLGATAATFVLLEGFWPIVTAQDYLPLVPPLMVSILGFVLAEVTRRPGARLAMRFAMIAIVAGEMGVVFADRSLDCTSYLPQEQTIAQVLRLTGPDDYVMDVKGETIFRPRPFYFALETISRKRIARGLIADDIPERLIATRTYVATIDWRFPARAQQFLSENYVPVGRVRVAGKWLQAPNEAGARELRFRVEIPGRYDLLTKSGHVSGLLDGTPFDAPVAFDRGWHTFRPSSPPRGLALVWATAVERGFTPFHLREGA